ncbi:MULTISPECIES: Replicative DNA helicase [Psychrobacter]|jgi:tetratricopeptide (TPR) repeat protein|uniref:Replicative DNA helicase n=1 Tax=Psychrobacter TaxID=497 RepID=UPI00086EBEB6|nr:MULTISPECIES: Replicative DNA helicase [Psychrobacter]MBA6244409.1 tetratricopeptide repeat protein [Psychrobacter sp. Urea-trap-18]MBA6287091.1 tetratricopeptide repeat protein [Psychrobacter sp. Urea-trap-16]MBA6319334.1 tetratricopeptide repeat protein [Psychrobacter sp. Urea-trap-20]MBA6335490.1 tetratricopeptide repeat protein [Psychrobacter sp. Urea-trap-19]OEH67190.1 MAG: Replicative DNA helicase [Psychrobacter sp. B29-1]|tara:strand:- start:2798 stop:3220 length:423 start_codon:yes stop_codon:yes gene_type:complete
MINTKIYKAIYTLAEELLEADRRGNQEKFDSLYAELNAICTDNEGTDKDHPEQWETLADFTEDLDAALVIYDKALAKATAINSKDHMSSIAFSMAVLQLETGEKEAAIQSLQNAKVTANKIEDKEFKVEIDEMLTKLLGE